MKQLDALFFLAWNLLALLWEKVSAFAQGQRNDKQQFLKQYKEDRLWSLSPAQRECTNRQGGCFHCGLCEAIFATGQHQTTAATDAAPQGQHHEQLPQSLFLGPSRDLSSWPLYDESGPDALTGTFDDQWSTRQQELSALCPAGLSFEEMREIYMKRREES